MDAFFLVEIQFQSIFDINIIKKFIIPDSIVVGVFTFFFIQFANTGAIQLHGIGEHRQDNILFGQFVIFGIFDRRHHVSDG